VERNADVFEAGYIETTSRPRELSETFRQTLRVYDALAPLYPISTLLFHRRAHRAALDAAAIRNGTRILEVAMGSGEMFRRLVKANPDGQTIGVDLSPNMAAHSQTSARRLVSDAAAQCQAADARALPFPAGCFDYIMCCYLFELLPEQEAASTVAELQRVLRPGGKLTLILVGENRPVFNFLYSFCARMAPAFWGQQVERRIARSLATGGFTIDQDHHVGQLFYSSRIISATY
jgi:ubiquinone/menaquinone biosynthesis C-methylase UbiE